jgi:hypothetical protein
VIRDAFNHEIPDSRKEVIRVSGSQIRAIVFRVLIEAVKSEEVNGDGQRKDVMAECGFGKFFKSTARTAGIGPLILRLSMSRLVVGWSASSR